MTYTFFHRTTDENAHAILEGGFRDSRGYWLFIGLQDPLVGVWVSDVPLDACNGAKGEALLEVMLDVTDDVLATHEIAESVKGYREWLFPASFLNANARVRLLTVEEEEELDAGLPSAEYEFVTGKGGRQYRLWQHPAGPVNPPLHVPGKWYWIPFDCPSEGLDSEEDPPYWQCCESREEAEQAALRFDAANPAAV